MSVNLQDLMNAIPVAHSGDVVTEDYHNSIRNLLAAVVSQVGGQPVSQTINLAFAPGFLSSPGQTPWVTSDGVANTGGPNTYGWLPLQLPDKVHIKSLTVIGQKNPTQTNPTGVIGTFQVKLVRQAFTDTAPSTIIFIVLDDPSVPSAPATFQVPGSPVISNPLAAQMALVDNGSFKYFVTAKFGGDANASARINTIQVVCSTSS